MIAKLASKSSLITCVACALSLLPIALRAQAVTAQRAARAQQPAPAPKDAQAQRPAQAQEDAPAQWPSPAQQDAQEPQAKAKRARGRCLVFARLPDGKPWVGAKVHAISWPLAELAIGQVDRVQAISDARGRVRFELLSGRCYSVWASQAFDGRLRVSGLEVDVMSGTRRSVTLAHEDAAKPIQLLAKLGKNAGSRTEWWAACGIEPRIRQRLELDNAGVAKMPALPWPLEIRVASNGRPAKGLADRRDSDSQTLHASVRLEDPRTAPGKLELPPLPLLVCKVRYAKGSAVPDATIWQARDGRWAEVGQTNSAGIALCSPLYRFYPSVSRYGIDSFLRSSAKGDRDARKRVVFTMPDPREAHWWTSGKHFDVELLSGYGGRVERRVFWKRGVAAAGLQLLMHRASRDWLDTPILANAAKSGSFLCHSSDNVFAVPTPQALSALGRDPNHPWLFPLWLGTPSGRFANDTADLVIGEGCAIVDVELRRADATPASFPLVAFGRGYWSRILRVARGSRRGRGRLMLPKGKRRRLGIGANGASVVVDLDLSEVSRTKVVLTLPKLLTIRGRVVDQEGHPVAAATVRANIVRAKGATKAENAGATTAPGTLSVDERLAKACIEEVQARSGRNGEFSLQLGPGNQFDVWASLGQGIQTSWSLRTLVRVHPDAKELVLKLDQATK